MRNILIDENQIHRCWNCGGKDFKEQRTTANKLLWGTRGGPTKGRPGSDRKLRCQTCGQYSDVGRITQRYQGPADPKFLAAYKKELADRQGAQQAPSPVVSVMPASSVADELKKLADLRDAEILTEDEFAVQKASILKTL
jgi:hypothetical protein